MYPTLKIGEIVVVKKVSFESIRIGDIIGFTSHKGVPLVHRTVWKTSKNIITVADASRRPDTPITRKEFMGKIIMKKHNDHWSPIPTTALPKKTDEIIAWLSRKIANNPSSLLYRAGRKILLFSINSMYHLFSFAPRRESFNS